jgi:hypothetical protein
MNLLLICGCGHTGSSILARIIGDHSDIYFVNRETGMFLANRHYLEDEYLSEFSESAMRENRKIILEKTPRHIWHVDYIRRKYPGTKFILTTREGRDTVASLYERTKDIGFSLTRYQDDSILTLRQVFLGDTYLQHYEKLIEDPQHAIKNICEWVGLNFEQRMLNFHLKPIEWNLNNPYSSGQPNNHDQLRNKQVNSPLQKNTISWQERVPKKYHAQIEDFFSKDGIGFKIMKDLGYPLV